IHVYTVKEKLKNPRLCKSFVCIGLPISRLVRRQGHCFAGDPTVGGIRCCMANSGAAARDPPSCDHLSQPLRFVRRTGVLELVTQADYRMMLRCSMRHSEHGGSNERYEGKTCGTRIGAGPSCEPANRGGRRAAEGRS